MDFLSHTSKNKSVIIVFNVLGKNVYSSLKIGKAAFEIIQAREEMKACARIM